MTDDPHQHRQIDDRGPEAAGVASEADTAHEPTAEQKALWCAQQRANVLLKIVMRGAGAQVTTLVQLLREYDAGTFDTEKNAQVSGAFGGLFMDCAILMEQIARVSGREFYSHQIPLLTTLPNLSQDDQAA
jgi:hypothetical protein